MTATRHPASPPNLDTRLNPFNGAIARKCACRGWIVAPEKVSCETGQIVAAHQISEPHKSFDREAWVERNTAQVTVTVRRVA